MTLATGSNALARLVEALGLQQRRVRALTVSVRLDEVVTVVAEMLADEEQLDALADTLTADVPPRVVEVLAGPAGEHEFHIESWTYECDQFEHSQGRPFRTTYAEALTTARLAAGRHRRGEVVSGRAVLFPAAADRQRRVGGRAQLEVTGLRRR
jgi:hypothetical protein